MELAIDVFAVVATCPFLLSVTSGWSVCVTVALVLTASSVTQTSNSPLYPAAIASLYAGDQLVCKIGYHTLLKRLEQ